MRTLDWYNLSRTYHDAVMTDHPVAYLPCTEHEGLTVHDRTGRADFTLKGSGLRNAGSVLPSASEDGSIYSDSGCYADGPMPNTARVEWGAEIWVRLLDFSQSSAVISNGVGGTNGYQLRTKTTGVYDIIFGGVVVTGAVPAQLYVPTHLFLSRSGGRVTLWVNGIPNFLTTATPTTPTTSATLGRFNYRGWYGHGAFYDYGVSANRIIEHYKAGVGAASRNRVAVSGALPWVYYRAGKGAAA